MKTGTYKLRCGQVLHLDGRNVSQDAIRNLMADPDLAPVMENIELFQDSDPDKAFADRLGTERMIQINSGAVRLFNYCIGWGVTDNPPAEEVAELKALGFDVTSPRVARVNWVRYLKADGTDEMGALIGRIMALAFADDKPEPEEKTIEELRAELERMKRERELEE